MFWLWEGRAANGQDAPKKKPQESEGQLPECCLAEVFRVYKMGFSLYISQIKTLNHQIHPVQSFYKPMSSCFGFWKEVLPMAKMLRRRNHRNQKASCQSVVWQRFSGFIKCFWLFFCPDQPLKHQIHPVQSFYKPIWWFCSESWRFQIHQKPSKA